MLLLIDGHNLIHALPDIDLSDPHDEVKLIQKLRAYCGRTGQRCVVIFDGGLPGGVSRALSSSQVTVVFAAAHHTDADTLLRKRIRQAADPGAVTLISSDRAVQVVARECRVRVVRSEDFTAQMMTAMSFGDDEGEAEVADSGAVDDVHLTPDEIEGWLDMFSRREDGE